MRRMTRAAAPCRLRLFQLRSSATSALDLNPPPTVAAQHTTPLCSPDLSDPITVTCNGSFDVRSTSALPFSHDVGIT